MQERVEPLDDTMRTAVIKFNTKPQLGINFLIEKELINGTPEEVAHFLFTDNINMTKVGDFLGEK